MRSDRSDIDTVMGTITGSGCYGALESYLRLHIWCQQGQVLLQPVLHGLCSLWRPRDEHRVPRHDRHLPVEHQRLAVPWLPAQHAGSMSPLPANPGSQRSSPMAAGAFPTRTSSCRNSSALTTDVTVLTPGGAHLARGVLPEHGDHAQAGGLKRGPPGCQRQVGPKVSQV